MARARSRPSRDTDTAWKVSLPPIVYECVEVVNPALYRQLDRSRRPEPLDREIQALKRGFGRRGRRAVDFLFRVWLLNGEEQLLLLHIEVQGSKQDDFPRRMFVYHARLVDHYNLPVTSIAIIVDSDPAWHPTTYTHNYFGSKLTFQFGTLKVLDWRGREAQLARSRNPFAQVLLAQLTVLTAKRELAPQIATWRAITRQLIRSKQPAEKIQAVLTFLQWMFFFPPEVEQQLATELIAQEGTMAQILSPWERRWLAQGIEQGREQGREQGIEQGRQELLLELLRFRCGDLDEAAVATINAMNEEQVHQLGRALFTFTGRADLDHWLASQPVTTSAR